MVPSAKGFGRKLDSEITGDIQQSGKRSGVKFGGALKAGLLGAAAGIGIASAKILSDSVGLASNAQQSLGATEAIFKDFAGEVVATSKGAAQEFGLSANDYRESANLLGALFKNQGVELDKLSGATEKHVGLAADLSAMYGGTAADAVDAITAAYKGEFNQLEKYGVTLKQSIINTEAETVAKEKYGKALKDLTPKQEATVKQLATQRLLMKQTGDASSAFAKESDTLAGQQQRLTAQWDDMKVAIGTRLLPILTDLLGYLNNTVLPGLSNMGDYVGEVKDALSPAVDAVKVFIDSFRGSNKATDSLKSARDSIKGVLDSIKAIFESASSAIRTIWSKVGADVVRYISGSLKNAAQLVSGAFKIIEGLFKTVAAVLKGDWKGAWDGIKKIGAGAKDVVVAIVKQLWNLVTTAFKVGAKLTISVVRELKPAIINAMKGAASWLLSAGRDVLVGLLNGIKGKVGSLLSFMGSIPGKTLSALGNVGSILYGAGVSLITGLGNGIYNHARDWLAAKVASVADWIPGWIKRRLGIASPSKVTTALGREVANGLAAGMDDGRNDVERAADRAIDTMLKKLDPKALRGAGFELGITGGPAVPRVSPSQLRRVAPTAPTRSDDRVDRLERILMEHVGRVERAVENGSRAGIENRVKAQAQKGRVYAR